MKVTRIVRVSLWQVGREADVWAVDVGAEMTPHRVSLVYVGAEGHAARCCWVILIFFRLSWSHAGLSGVGRSMQIFHETKPLLFEEILNCDGFTCTPQTSWDGGIWD